MKCSTRREQQVFRIEVLQIVNHSFLKFLKKVREPQMSAMYAVQFVTKYILIDLLKFAKHECLKWKKFISGTTRVLNG